MFHAKVIFLESATLHLKNQATQMQKWKAFKVLAARFWMGVCSSCSFSRMITGNSTRIEKFSKCYRDVSKFLIAGLSRPENKK